MNTLPHITKSQKIIISFLFKFRFTTVSQLQKYMNHKNHQRIRTWLNDLKKKGYIAAISDSKDITKPTIFCLDTKARYLLKEKNVSTDFLNKIYKEKKLSEAFKNHCIFLVTVYLFFLSNLERGSKLAFLTPHELDNFEYLPKDIDAYIAVENKGKVKRYFLELFDEYRKSNGQARYSIRKYITYSEDGDWQANTNNSPMPSILFVLSDERKRKHIMHYGKAKLSKTFEELSLFLTTQDIIRFSKNGQNIWQSVV